MLTLADTPAALAVRVLTPRVRLARRAIGAALLLGALADPLLREEPWGIGLGVWMAAFGSAVLWMFRQAGRPLLTGNAIWIALAVLFAASISWRDGDLLQFVDVVAMLAALVLLAMSVNAIPVPTLGMARVRDLIAGAIGTGMEVAIGAIPLALADVDLQDALRPSRVGQVPRISRALLISAPIVIAFTVLLANADPIFGSFFRFPNVDLGVAVSHVVVAGFFAWVTAGWLRRAFLKSPADATSLAPFPLVLSATDLRLGLGALNLLFAAFVLVQLGWLFGGEAIVLKTTGLSYAAYARRGFFELTGVAGLLLVVLLSAQALIPQTDARALRAFRGLALSLVLLLVPIMLSAGARMTLYVHFYGMSTDRLYAIAVMIWLAVVFIWMTMTLLRSRPRAFATGLVASGFVALFTLNCINPEAIVARENLARGATHDGIAGADLRYIVSLGGDAAALVVTELTAAGNAVDAVAHMERCNAARILLDRWSGIRAARMLGNWAHWNAGRSRAVATVRDHEGELRALACPAGKPDA